MGFLLKKHFSVKDNGDLDGIGEEDLHATLNVLNDLVHRANLSIQSSQIITVHHFKYICQVRIELEAADHLSALQLNQDGREGRVLFLGAAGSGKTTLLSVLTDWGSLDDGRGKMRTRLLHHRHELLSGATSSVTHHPLVFLNSPLPLSLTTDDSVLLQLERRKEILSEAKVVQLIDSAGKLRFDRTVFSGLTSAAHPPDLAFIVLEAPSASASTIPAQTLETYKLLDRLGIPVAILITKIDQSSTESISNLLEDFSAILKDKKSLEIYDEGTELGSMTEGRVPVLLTSALKGDFLPSLAHFLYTKVASPQPPRPHPSNRLMYAQESSASAFSIEQVVHLAGVGPVVYGQVAFGRLWTGDEMTLGPIERGDPIRVRIKSIQRLKCPVSSASSSQHVSLALQFIQDSDSLTAIHRGMALLQLRTDTSSQLVLKPLRRIIAEVEQISGDPQQRFIGVVFVMGQRFPATLDVQPRLHRRASVQSTPPPAMSVCLVTLGERRPATVFLFPTAPIIFIGNGRREKFVGRVVDYFA